MLPKLEDYAPPPPDFSAWLQFAVKWTPRSIVAGLTGYYCLGLAYEMGLMAAIDRVAIRILRPSLGYMGMAAFMPTFQWYSAWGVRIIAALGAGVIYEVVERILRAAFRRLFSSPQEENSLAPAPLHRPPSPLIPDLVKRI